MTSRRMLDEVDADLIWVLKSIGEPSRVRTIAEKMHGSHLANSQLARHTNTIRYHLGHLQEFGIVRQDMTHGIALFGFCTPHVYGPAVLHMNGTSYDLGDTIAFPERSVFVPEKSLSGDTG